MKNSSKEEAKLQFSIRRSFDPLIIAEKLMQARMSANGYKGRVRHTALIHKPDGRPIHQNEVTPDRNDIPNPAGAALPVSPAGEAIQPF